MAIYPDKDKQGALTGRYRVELQLKGRRARGTFTTLEEAQAADQQWRTELVTTVTTAPAILKSHDKRDRPQTLGQLFDKAKDKLWRGKSTEAQSLARCMEAIRLIGVSTPLSTLKTSDIDTLIVNLQVDKSDATVNRYLSALHTLLAWGVDRDYLIKTPKMAWQNESAGRIRWITEDEETRLLEQLGTLGFDRVADVVKVAIATGMRRNEILGLTKDNVEPTWVRLWKTKNGTARSVPIGPETHKCLQRLLKAMPTQCQLRYAFEAAKAAIGLKDDPLFVFHATRHTCASRLVRDNIHLSVIKSWLGHKRLETTQRYTHVNDEMLTAALAKTTLGYTHVATGNPSRDIPKYGTGNTGGNSLQT